jgi:hypothetical protein
MAKPCWKCGSVKLDPTEYPAFLCWLVKVFRSQLCICGGCHRLRLTHRSDWTISPYHIPPGTNKES